MSRQRHAVSNLNRVCDLKIGERLRAAVRSLILGGLWWALQDSNLRLPPCEGGRGRRFC